jgi:hypothetical protein
MYLTTVRKKKKSKLMTINFGKRDRVLRSMLRVSNPSSSVERDAARRLSTSELEATRDVGERLRIRRLLERGIESGRRSRKDGWTNSLRYDSSVLHLGHDIAEGDEIGGTCETFVDAEERERNFQRCVSFIERD